MFFRIPGWARSIVGLLLLPPGVSATEMPTDFAAAGRPFLERFCIGCHGGESPEAELTLESYRDAASLVAERKVWDNVLKVVEAGEMPPPDAGRPVPTPAEVGAFTARVRGIFDHADRHAEPDPGRVTMRRLNRVEYRNTIRDLIGIEFDPTEDFPSDDIGHGFDNIGDVLTLPPVLMERYLDAAESILGRAITPVPPPVPKRHLSAVFTEPASAEVRKRVVVNNLRRMTSDGTEPIETGPLNTPYLWEQSGEYIFRTRVFGTTVSGHPVTVGLLVQGPDLPDPTPAAELERFAGGPIKSARLLATFEVKATDWSQAEVLEVRLPPMPHRHRMLIALEKPAPDQPPAALYVESLSLEGPLDTRPPSHGRLLATSAGTPAEQTRDVLGRFLRRAYRRPPSPEELQRLARLAEEAVAGGGTWEAGIQLAMQAALCSPKFLFRMELDADPTSPTICDLDEFQLASRLSYFLWSSMPDDRLLDLAEQRQLVAQLDAEVRRMLADPRAVAIVRNFAMQWLQIKRLEFFSPDGQLFPTFNVGLREAMLRETELFFESILREDRSILDLIDADYTFLNEPLARHYGIGDTLGHPIGAKPSATGGTSIRGETFRRVALQDRTRGGLLTQASVLAVTSNPTRTSPVKRGKWVLEQMLGAPPPPPPPNVPELNDDAEASAGGSLRQRMEVHRRKAACGNCHSKMDPIGFALENFDAIGGFRTRDGEFEVDAAGEFADGTRFTGPAELKTILLGRKDDFVRCLTEKLLIYAIGRGLEFYDRPTVERIVTGLPEQDYRFSALVRGIVHSDAFRQRRGP